MKNILVPTDFSVFAEYAIDAAQSLAEKFNATVYVFHNVSLPNYLASLPKAEQENHKEVLQITHNANILLEDTLKKFKGNAYPILRKGKLIDNINQIVPEKGIDMVVMGSHGTSGKNEFFIGSNTQKAVRVVHCPVLVLKRPLGKLDFNKIVYASSFNVDERDSILKFKKIIKHFIPEVIHLLTIHTSGFFSPPYVLEKAALDDCGKLLHPFEVHNHVYRDFTVSGGIQNFVANIKPDLLVVSNHQRHPLKRMLRGSNVEALVNHVDIPVLTIDYTFNLTSEDFEELNNLTYKQ